MIIFLLLALLMSPAPEIPEPIVITEIETIQEIRYIDDMPNHHVYSRPRGNGSPAIMVNRDNIPEATIDDVREFIATDTTKNNLYIEDEYICTDYAVDLHNNAENAGFMAGVVHLSLEDGVHAITVFATRDGWFFVDNRGNGYIDLADTDFEIAWHEVTW